MKFRLTFVLPVLLAALAAGASTVIRMDLAALSRGADLVVLGAGRSATVRWNAEKTRIYTDTVVAVEQTVKGAAVKEVVVRQLGGEIDGLGMIASGVLHLNPGEEVVLFLGPDQDGYRRILGLWQGRFTVLTDPADGKKWVNALPDLSGTGARAEGEAGRVPLIEFLAQVRKALAVKP